MSGTPNLVDALLLLVVLLGAAAGTRRGFLGGVLGLAVLAGTLAVAFGADALVAEWLQPFAATLGVWRLPLAFVLAFAAARLLFGAVAGRLAAAVPARVHAHGANRALGALPGLVNGGITAAVLALVLLVAPLGEGVARLAQQSLLAAPLAAPAQWLEAQLAPVFDEAVSRTLVRRTVEPTSRERVQLPFTVAQPRVRPDLEARMLELVNAERQSRGLAPLAPDPELAEVARAHARDMLARGYFGHVTPDGQDPFDRMRQSRVRYLTAGENLALARSLAMAHHGLMESPGHRANILRPQFGRAGIGVLDAGVHGLMVTQNFRN